VVGLGHIAQVAVLPGIAQARHSRISALISDEPLTLRGLARRYHPDRTCTYAQFDECMRSGGIDAVYLALPNHRHHEFALRAARAGIHVLCEKPLAVTSGECREMIAAARDTGVRLMVAYRLHFAGANLRASAAAAGRRLGDLRIFNSVFTMQVAPGNVRTQSIHEGGGPLYDLGVYCINAARHLFRAHPEEVLAVAASGRDSRFVDCDEMNSVILRFPGGRLATFTASFGAASTAAYDLIGTRGILRMEQAYEYDQPMTQRLMIDGRTRTSVHARHDRFAAEVDYFSQCVLHGREPEPGGEEGLADVEVIEAVLESVRSRRPVAVSASAGAQERERHPEPAQELAYPAHREPEVVGVGPPRRG
jgi:glucose-fructose oxidoreductase